MSDTTSYVDYLSQARQLNAQDNLEAAMAACQKALAAAATAAATGNDISGPSAVMHHMAFYRAEFLQTLSLHQRAVEQYKRSVDTGRDLQQTMERFPALGQVMPAPCCPYINVACHRIAMYHAERRQADEAQTWFDQALDGSGGYERAQILCDRGQMLGRLGKYGESIGDLSEATKLFEYHNQTEGVGMALALTGLVLVRRGSLSEAAERLSEADQHLLPGTLKLHNLIQLAATFDRLQEQPEEDRGHRVYLGERDEVLRRAESLLPEWGNTGYRVSVFVLREGGYRTLELLEWALERTPGLIKQAFERRER